MMLLAALAAIAANACVCAMCGVPGFGSAAIEAYARGICCVTASVCVECAVGRDSAGLEASTAECKLLPIAAAGDGCGVVNRIRSKPDSILYSVSLLLQHIRMHAACHVERKLWLRSSVEHQRVVVQARQRRQAHN